MRKYFYVLMVAVFATMSLAVTGCSKDDNDLEGGNLVGTWKVDGMSLGNQYLQFKSNGEFFLVYVPGDLYDDPIFNGIVKTEISKGKWTRNENTVNIVYDDGDKTSFKIEKITSKELRIMQLGLIEVYERVPDSEIAPYLE